MSSPAQVHKLAAAAAAARDKDRTRLRKLTGFVGKSSDDGLVRLYLSTRFDDYVEVPSEDIVGTSELTPTEETPHGGDVLFVRETTKLTRVHDIDLRELSLDAQVEFLQGGSNKIPISDARAMLMGGRIQSEPAALKSVDSVTGVFCSITLSIAIDC